MKVELINFDESGIGKFPFIGLFGMRILRLRFTALRMTCKTGTMSRIMYNVTKRACHSERPTGAEESVLSQCVSIVSAPKGRQFRFPTVR